MKYDLTKVNVPLTIAVLVRQGITIEFIKRKCNVSRSTVYMWRNGIRTPRDRASVDALVTMASDCLLSAELEKCGIEVEA